MTSFKISASGGQHNFMWVWQPIFQMKIIFLDTPNTNTSKFGITVMLTYGRLGIVSSKSTVSTTNRDHRYTIIYTGTSLRFYLDNTLQTTVSRNANLEHYAMFKFNSGHTSISKYDIKFEKIYNDYFNVGSDSVNNATVTTDGLMSSSDKTKLDGISSETFKTISVMDKTILWRTCWRYPYIVILRWYFHCNNRGDTINFSYGGAHTISPLEWTASSGTHSYSDFTVTTSSNSSPGYIRSTNGLTGPCMTSFKISASGDTPILCWISNRHWECKQFTFIRRAYLLSIVGQWLCLSMGN